MEIKKISKIAPLNPIPSHHLKWTGYCEETAQKKKKPKTLSGELILYDRCGRIIKHNIEE